MKSVRDQLNDNQLLKEALRQHDLKRGDVDVIRDDPHVQHEEVHLKPGEREVIIFDATTKTPQTMTVHDFDLNQDAVLFVDMQGKDLFVGGRQFPSGEDGVNPAFTVLTPGAHTSEHGVDPPFDQGVTLVWQPYNFDLYERDALWPRNSYDIHFNGTIIG